VFVAAGVLTGCGTAGGSQAQPSTATPWPTATAVGGDSPQSGPFTQTLKFSDGLTVRISHIAHTSAKGGSTEGVAAGDPLVRLTITITAGRVAVNEPLGTAALTYGDTGTAAKSVNEGDDSGFLTSIPAGTPKSQVRTWAVPTKDAAGRCVLVYTVDATHEADFVGPVSASF
jgi:hypothetical protein